MDCEQTLAFATDEFNAGHFYSVPSILNECLTGFNRDQRQRAYLLLTQTYLLLDDPIGAERSYLEILWANPEFVPDEKLHAIDVVYLSKRFTATPKFSWFVGAGSNVSPVRVIHDLEPAVSDEKYSLLPGYIIGAGGEYSFNDEIKVRVEANFIQTRYKVTASGHFADWEGYNAYDRKTFTDRQTWFNVPLYLCYSDNFGTYRPYGYAGFSLSSLLGDVASVKLENNEPLRESSGSEPDERQEIETLPSTSPDFQFLDRRNKLNHSVILGAGIKYKVGLDFVFAELRYSAGLKNVVNIENVYGNTDYDQTSSEHVESITPAAAYGHVDDLFRLDNIAITVGFLRPLYKPRELKRVKTKGILRKMKRGR